MAKSLKISIANNIKTDYRRWRMLILEVVIILFLFIVIVWNPVAEMAYNEMDETDAEKTHAYANQELDVLPNIDQFSNSHKAHKLQIAYTPDQKFSTKIIGAVSNKLELGVVDAFDTSDMLETLFDEKIMLAAVELPKVEGDEIPKSLNVRIRFPSEFRTLKLSNIHENLWITRCNGVLSQDSASNAVDELYIREGFLQLQHQIFLEWYQMLTDKTPTSFVLPKIYVRSFRHHTEDESCRAAGTSNLTSFLYYFVFMVPFLNLIWKYGREREENMLVHHWKYGCQYCTYWWAHFIVSFVHLLLLDILIIIIVKVSWTDNPLNGVFRETSFIILLLFLVLYSVGMILFVMILVSWIVDAKSSVLIGVILWLATYALLSTTLNHSKELKSPFAIISFVLFFNSSFAYGMAYLKEHGKTSQSDVWILLGSMLGNIVLELLILYMVQHFWPGNYMEDRYLCEKSRKKRRAKLAKQKKKTTVSLLERTPSWHNFEFGPVGSEHFIRLKNVFTYLKYNSKVQQHLKNISMRIFKGEITVLLGPSGSGKTTLIRVLGGLKKPSTGWVKVDEKDIYEECKGSRPDIDLSMPNNTLLDLLTVEETLKYHFYLKCPGTDESRMKVELKKWSDTLRPTIPKGSIMVKDMSFGQKRLLCLCCTLSADTKIVLLDEPTLHMREQEAHLYWKILNREKPDRAIILATFSVDEAEVIGDRIAMLNNGILMAYGTQFFLKSKYSAGYDLIISKEPEFSTARITEFLGQFIPDITPENDIGDQLIYKIPSDKRPIFQKILIFLERESANLGIENMRMVGADISEAFMKRDERNVNQIVADKSSSQKLVYVDKKHVWKQQVFALLYKKLLYQAPNIIPVIMIAATVLLIVFIGELTKDFKPPAQHHNKINLGFPDSTTDRSDILSNINNCEFVEIKSIDTEKLFIKENTKSLIFTKSSLSCENETHEEFIKKKKIYEKYGGVEIETENYTSWFNQRIFHMAPASLNLLHNLILKNAFPDNDDIFTTVINDPMALPLRLKINLLDQQLSHLRVPLTVGIVVPISISCFIFFVVEEKRSSMLLLQVMAGMRMKAYWMVNFLWDWGTYFAYSVIFIIIMTFTTIEGFGIEAKMLTLLLISVYGFAGLAMTYLVSLFCYTSPLRSFLIAVIIQLLTGLCAYVFYWDVIENNAVFFYIASIAPSFALLDGVSNVYTETKGQEYCMARCESIEDCNAAKICEYSPRCCGESFFKFKDPGILLSLASMILSCIIFGLIIFLVEQHRRERKFLPPKNIKQLRSVCDSHDDSDVVNVKKYIADADMKECRQYRFVVDQLENHIPKKRAKLKSVSFALDKHVCMGIFGARHVGKTHLMKQLVGEHGFAFGDVYVRGVELKYDLAKAYENMSYCPQDGGYFRLFTPHELLRMLCLIRGIREDKISERIREIALSLNMRKYLRKPIAKLSFEKRRKAAIALALVANSEVLLLDEPTRGLSAVARREIWNVLRYERFCDKTIIVTSTDTMECEALADYVILFNDGEMWAIGSTQHLRQKLTKGFFLEIKLKRDGTTAEDTNANFHKDIENVHRFVSFLHEDSELWSRVDNFLKYYVPVEHIKYSYLYGALEKNRRRLNISDYTVSQGTMKDVFRNISAGRPS